MTGICIGIGKGWDKAAEITARRMEQMTGIYCFAWNEPTLTKDVANPAWLKCHVLSRWTHDAAPFFVFDADVLPMRPWNPIDLYRGRFTGVPESPVDLVRQECNAYGLRVDRYLNGGLLIFDANHRSIWDETWSRHPHYGRWLEQTSLNKSLDGKSAALLPRTFNTIVRPNTEDLSPAALKARPEVNLHLAGLRGDTDTLLRVQEGLGWGKSSGSNSRLRCCHTRRRY